MVQTEVIWNLPTDPAADAVITAKLQELIDQGKEAATPLIFDRGDQKIVARWWVDEPTAIQWVDFVEQHQPRLFSAEIIHNG